MRRRGIGKEYEKFYNRIGGRINFKGNLVPSKPGDRK
jgi:hypothetical protein